MSTLDEIKKEIVERHKSAGQHTDTTAASQEAPKEKTNKVKPAKKEMTKAEIEAYKQKMIEKEEARYLGKQAKKAKKAKSEKPAKPVKKSKEVQKVQKSNKEQNVQKPHVQTVKMPKVLKPLVPMYLLRIPGLPKGDCLAICYAEGADA